MPLDDPLLCDFPSVVLQDGVGKYVQIELRNPSTSKERLVIRHDVESDFHIEVAEKTVREAEFKVRDIETHKLRFDNIYLRELPIFPI